MSQGAWWAWLYAVLAHGTLLAGMCVPRCGWIGPVVNRLPTTRKTVWLTIDDGPSDDTVALAGMLQGKGVAATFFLQGSKLAQRPETAALLEAAGHGMANHSMHHSLMWFWALPPHRLAREIDDCTAVLERGPARPEPWFRCPAGVKNPFLHSILRRRGLLVAGWTVRAYDGIRCDADQGLARIRKRLVPGAILLVHEGKRDRNGNPASVEFISRLVDVVHEAGYQFARPGSPAFS